MPRKFPGLMALALPVLWAMAAPAQALGVPAMGTWEASLQSRDIDGDGLADAYYDSALDITWLGHGNAGAGSAFDSALKSTATDGKMNWADANAWAASLDVSGVTGWRLPTLMDTGAGGCQFSRTGGTDCGHSVQTISGDGATVYSELAHLYRVTLGNRARFDAAGNDLGYGSAPTYLLENTGPFTDLHAWPYWTALPYAPNPTGQAWFFHVNSGVQYFTTQGDELFAIAVHEGDVAAVPEPGTTALLALGLAVMAWAGRRHRRVR